MDVRAEFLKRMYNAAAQFKRELQAADAADGLAEHIHVNETRQGVEVIFFAQGPAVAPFDPNSLPLIGKDGHLVEDESDA